MIITEGFVLEPDPKVCKGNLSRRLMFYMLMAANAHHHVRLELYAQWAHARRWLVDAA